jgi:glycosyltransferase involved in cell wall biosynthesis
MFAAEHTWLTPSLPHSPDLVEAVLKSARDYDCVINHSLWNPVASNVMRGLRRRKIDYCLFTHGMLDPVVFRRHRLRKTLWASLCERSNIESAALIVFNSRAEEEKARKCGWHFRRTLVLPHAVKLAEWKMMPAREEFDSLFPRVRGRELILYVGRIDWVKNLDVLIDALALLQHTSPRVMLACVGPDSNGHRADLERQAQRSGVDRHLLFTGMLEGRELKAAYGRADAFVLVSKKENFGLSAAEALASGLPIVLSEGVDLGRDLPEGGPILRVKAAPDAIACALERQLGRSRDRGLPDIEARLLADARLGQSHIELLFSAYSEAIGLP